MKKARIFSVFSVALLMLQIIITPIGNNFIIAAESDDVDFNIKVTDSNAEHINWKIEWDSQLTEDENFEFKVFQSEGLSLGRVNKPGNVTMNSEPKGTSFTVPSNQPAANVEIESNIVDTSLSIGYLTVNYNGKEIKKEVAIEQPEIENIEENESANANENDDENNSNQTNNESSENNIQDDNKEGNSSEENKNDGKVESKKSKESNASNDNDDEIKKKENEQPVLEKDLEKNSDQKTNHMKLNLYDPNTRSIQKKSTNEKPTVNHKLERSTSDNICIREVEGEINFTLPAPEEKRPVDIVVVQDASGSYAGNETNARNSLKALAEMLDYSAGDRMMVTSYQGYKGWRYYTTFYPNGRNSGSGSGWKLENLTGLSNNETVIKNQIDKINFDNGTPTASGLQFALQQYNAAVSGQDLSNRETIFVLVTDGVANARLDGRVHIDGSVLDEQYQRYQGTFAEVESQAAAIKNSGYKLFSAYWENLNSLRNTYGTNYYNNTIGPAAQQMLMNVATSSIYFSVSDDLQTVMDALLASLATSINSYNGFKAEFDIDSEFDLVPNSLYLNGSQLSSSDYTISGNTVTITKNSIPSGDNKITYKLKENTAHANDTTPITNGMIHYDKEGSNYKVSVEIPEAIFSANSNADLCEFNIDKGVANSDSSSFNDSIDLSTNEEVFQYKLTYQFDGSVGEKSSVQLKDELEAVLELVGNASNITISGINPSQYTINLLSNKSGFIVDLNSQNGSYDYLAGQTINVYFNAKIREGTTQADLDAYTDHKIPNKAQLLIDNDLEVSDDVYVKPVSKGKVQIVKIDEKTEKRLEGATFNILDSDGNVVDTITTDSNGEATSIDLPVGDYTLEEVEAPEGYEFTQGQTYDFTIIEGQTVYLDITNKKQQGTIKLIKVDEDDDTKTLEGAKFNIKDAGNNIVASLTTDSNGVATSGPLDIGEYTLIEIESPYGYALTEGQALNVTVTADEEVVITVTNKALKGSVTIIKVDEDGNIITSEDAEFILRDADGEEIARDTTDANGKIVFDDLSVGKYQIVETKAPNGYQLLRNPIEIEITPDDLNIEETVVNSEQGWSIPSTGGMGTVIFYGLGLLLMALAGTVFFITRKKTI